MQIRRGRILKKIWYRIRISRESLTERFNNKLRGLVEWGVKLGYSVPVSSISCVTKQKSGVCRELEAARPKSFSWSQAEHERAQKLAARVVYNGQWDWSKRILNTKKRRL